MDISRHDILKAAQYSMDIYKGLAGPDVYPFDKSNIQGSVVFDQDSIWIVFRGTDEVKDWLVNLDMAKLPGPGRGEEVHRGFEESFQLVSSEIVDILTSANLTTKRKQIFITGHSLGGAIATVCARHLFHTPRPKLITFGSPRVGNSDFICAIPGKHVRVVNSADPVTQVPAGLRFDHGGREIWFNQEGQVEVPSFFERLGEVFKSAAHNWIRGDSLSLANHDMVRYFENCSRMAGR